MERMDRERNVSQLQEVKRESRRLSKTTMVCPLPQEGGSLLPRAQKPDYVIDGNGCWVWQKHTDRKGYGKAFFTAQKTQWAHKAYWIAANGPLPEGRHIVIDHLCRNPSCVNPKHLEAVEQATNVHRGEAAKLTMEIAREVRRRTREGQPAGQIHRELGVTIQNIWWINEDLAWREDPTAPRQPVRPERDCEYCGTPITEGYRSRVYCNKQCRDRAHDARRRKKVAS